MKQFFVFAVFFLIVFFVRAQSVKSYNVQELKNAISASSKEIVVVNFWATYCRPCIREIPDLIQVAQKHVDKVELILVNLDDKKLYPKSILQFVKRHHFKARVIWLNETDPNYFCYEINPGWQGSIPATIFFNKKTGKEIFKEDELSAQEISEILDDWEK